MTTLIDKIPDMTDDALANLRANADRLGRDGTAAQKTASAALMPAIEAESARRAEVKREAMAARREEMAARRAAAPRKSRAKPAAAKATG